MPGQAGPQSPDAAETSDVFSALVHAVRAFQSRAAELDMALDGLAGRDAVSPRVLGRINDSLTRVERSFLLPGGLAGRPWFKHAVYAPGVTTGYGAWPLPAIRQTLEENKPDQLRPDRSDRGGAGQSDRRSRQGHGRSQGRVHSQESSTLIVGIRAGEGSQLVLRQEARERRISLKL